MFTRLNKLMNREDGFTLIELLIVVLIIGVLAAIAIPVYLGIQNQAHKSAIKADVNVAVKQVQVSLTEGQNITALYGTKNGSDKGETVQVKASTTSGASASDFMVIGTESTTGGSVNYTYSYDSFTGQFTDSDASVALGGGNTGGTGTFSPTVVYSKSFTAADTGSFPTGWLANGCGASGVTANNGDYNAYAGYCTNGYGYITTATISLPAGTYTASSIIAGYNSQYAATTGQIVVRKASDGTNIVLSTQTAVSPTVAQTTPTFTLSIPTNIKLALYGYNSGVTYEGFGVQNVQITQTAQ